MRRLFVLALLSVPAGVMAMCGAPLDPWSALQESDTVFFGVARAVHRDPWKAPLGHGARTVEFDVFARWKGADRDTIIVRTYDSSGMNGYPFQQGEWYLVYGAGAGDTVFTTHCDRTCPDSAAYADMANLGKPTFDRRQGMDWKQLNTMWRAANGLPVIQGPTFRN